MFYQKENTVIKKTKIKFKLKIKWLSSKKIDEKIYKYKSLPGWKPDASSLDDLIKFVLKDYKT